MLIESLTKGLIQKAVQGLFRIEILKTYGNLCSKAISKQADIPPKIVIDSIRYCEKSLQKVKELNAPLSASINLVILVQDQIFLNSICAQY